MNKAISYIALLIIFIISSSTTTENNTCDVGALKNELKQDDDLPSELTVCS